MTGCYLLLYSKSITTHYHSGMTPSTHEADDSRRDWTDDRYAELAVQDDALLIYDQKNHRAWIRSDGAVSISSML
jgi:hypothetical protein